MTIRRISNQNEAFPTPLKVFYDENFGSSVDMNSDSGNAVLDSGMYLQWVNNNDRDFTVDGGGYLDFSIDLAQTQPARVRLSATSNNGFRLEDGTVVFMKYRTSNNSVQNVAVGLREHDPANASWESVPTGELVYHASFSLESAILNYYNSQTSPHDSSHRSKNFLTSIANDTDYSLAFVNLDGTLTLYMKYNSDWVIIGTYPPVRLTTSEFFIYIGTRDGSAVGQNTQLTAVRIAKLPSYVHNVVTYPDVIPYNGRVYDLQSSNLHISGQWINGSSGEVDFYFRQKDANNYYRFNVAASGTITVYRNLEGAGEVSIGSRVVTTGAFQIYVHQSGIYLWAGGSSTGITGEPCTSLKGELTVEANYTGGASEADFHYIKLVEISEQSNSNGGGDAGWTTILDSPAQQTILSGAPLTISKPSGLVGNKDVYFRIQYTVVSGTTRTVFYDNHRTYTSPASVDEVVQTDQTGDTTLQIASTVASSDISDLIVQYRPASRSDIATILDELEVWS